MDALGRAFCEYLSRKVPCTSKEVAKVIKNSPCRHNHGVKKVKYELDNLIRKKIKQGIIKYLLTKTARNKI